ncbi:Dot/Icm type IV secretion system effector CetCb1 [Coxiella burnetii]|uniref:Dot/Icm type IV secretion system effector CetCb1 n=1 Tax=Coxiella burnetii TaxID=777 RepID=UPI000BFC2D58|nr:Dot/Icm type IV secretion system effector CetCb1 [Coxiella burnetii]PHH56878.1 hypothetical protein CRH12_08435 [Coxiella burnetii]
MSRQPPLTRQVYRDKKNQPLNKLLVFLFNLRSDNLPTGICPGPFQELAHSVPPEKRNKLIAQFGEWANFLYPKKEESAQSDPINGFISFLMEVILINPYDYNENFYKKLAEIIKIKKSKGLTWHDCLKDWLLTELTALDITIDDLLKQNNLEQYGQFDERYDKLTSNFLSLNKSLPLSELEIYLFFSNKNRELKKLCGSLASMEKRQQNLELIPETELAAISRQLSILDQEQCSAQIIASRQSEIPSSISSLPETSPEDWQRSIRIPIESINMSIVGAIQVGLAHYKKQRGLTDGDIKNGKSKSYILWDNLQRDIKENPRRNYYPHLIAAFEKYAKKENSAKTCILREMASRTSTLNDSSPFKFKKNTALRYFGRLYQKIYQEKSYELERLLEPIFVLTEKIDGLENERISRESNSSENEANLVNSLAAFNQITRKCIDIDLPRLRQNNEIISLIKDIDLTINRLNFPLSVEVINQIMTLLNGWDNSINKLKEAKEVNPTLMARLSGSRKALNEKLKEEYGKLLQNLQGNYGSIKANPNFTLDELKAFEKELNKVKQLNITELSSLGVNSNTIKDQIVKKEGQLRSYIEAYYNNHIKLKIIEMQNLLRNEKKNFEEISSTHQNTPPHVQGTLSSFSEQLKTSLDTLSSISAPSDFSSTDVIQGPLDTLRSTQTNLLGQCDLFTISLEFEEEKYNTFSIKLYHWVVEFARKIRNFLSNLFPFIEKKDKPRSPYEVTHTALNTTREAVSSLHVPQGDKQLENKLGHQSHSHAEQKISTATLNTQGMFRTKSVKETDVNKELDFEPIASFTK